MAKKQQKRNRYKDLLEKLKPHNWGQRFFFGIACVSTLLLLLSGLSVYISPTIFPPISLLSLAFPIFLIGAISTTLLIVVFAPRIIWLPLLGLLLCFPFIRTYYPINFNSEQTNSKDLKVMSWNVYGFWGDDLNRNYENGKKVPTYNPTARHISSLDPDIVCLQEAYGDYKEFIEPYITKELKALPYHMHNAFNGSVLLCYSRYPIIRHKRLCRQNSNGSMVYWIEKTPGDTILVINNHLSTMGLNHTDREEFKAAIENPEENLHKYTVWNLVRKLTKATKRRAQMADTVANFILTHRNYPTIVCGDFNDTPISYARQRISRGLTDAYRYTGNGLGRTFHKDAIVVRIDHMFCSKHFKPIKCYIDKSTQRSDHYPIIAFLRPEKQEKDNP